MEQNKALLERIRLFVLDLDGTIYLGDRLLPGAAEFITTAKEKGRQVLFFTNNTSRSLMEYVERLSRMGIPVTREDILTAGDVTIHYLQTHCAGQSVYLLGVPALRQSFAEAGIPLTEEQPDLVVVGFDKTLTYERLEKACIYLRRGAHFLATHPDINCPTEAEPIPDCGAICQAITTSTGFMPRSLGKPAAETVELVEAVSGLPREAPMRCSPLSALWHRCFNSAIKFRPLYQLVQRAVFVVPIYFQCFSCERQVSNCARRSASPIFSEFGICASKKSSSASLLW